MQKHQLIFVVSVHITMLLKGIILEAFSCFYNFQRIVNLALVNASNGHIMYT